MAGNAKEARFRAKAEAGLVSTLNNAERVHTCGLLQVAFSAESYVLLLCSSKQ